MLQFFDFIGPSVLWTVETAHGPFYEPFLAGAWQLASEKVTGIMRGGAPPVAPSMTRRMTLA